MDKHILIISQYYYPENFRINDIAQEWFKRGYEITVITGIPNYPKGRFYKGYGYFRKRKEVINGIKIIRLALIPRFNNPLMLILNYLSFILSGWFWTKYTRIKADLVFNFEVSPMTQSLLAIWYAKKHKIPSIVYVQDLWPENLQIVGGVKNKFIINQVNKMANKIYAHATRILVTSTSFKQSIIARNIVESKCIVWPQYAEDFYTPIKTKFRSIDQPLRIIFTGNIGEAQGLDILPKVASKLKTEAYSNQIKFIIVGDGRNKKNLINVIAEMGVTDMFEFISSKPAVEIPLILSYSDVAFLSFANNELFRKTIPAKLQSYMSCGMPILAVADGESKRIVLEAGCGLVSVPNDIDGLFENILQFYSYNYNNFKELSRRSRDYYTKNFNRKDLMDKFDLIIKEIC